MSIRTFAVLALVAASGVASAQTLSTVGPASIGGGTFGDRATNYSWDDGVSENSVGLTSGGVLAAIHFFPVTAGDNVITSVDVTWGTALFAGQNGVVPGTPINYYVWANVGVNTDPTGANSQLLFAGADVIAAASTDTDIFQSLAVPNIPIGTTSFFVGVSVAHAAGQFPIGVDTTAPTFGPVSWAGGGAAFNPANVGFGAGGAIDIATAGLGNWMLRANAVPAPASLALIGLGGLVVGRRRR